MHSSYSIRNELLYERHIFIHYKINSTSYTTGYSDIRPLLSENSMIVYYDIDVKTNSDNKIRRKNIEIQKFNDRIYFYIYAVMEKKFEVGNKIKTKIEFIIYNPSLRNLKQLIQENKLYFLENSLYPVHKCIEEFSLPLTNFDVEIEKADVYEPAELPRKYEVITPRKKLEKDNKLIIILDNLLPKSGYFFKIRDKNG